MSGGEQTMLATVELPDVMKSIVEIIQGVATIKGWDDTHLTIEIEADSEFDLGVALTELRHEITATACEALTVEGTK